MSNLGLRFDLAHLSTNESNAWTSSPLAQLKPVSGFQEQRNAADVGSNPEIKYIVAIINSCSRRGQKKGT